MRIKTVAVAVGTILLASAGWARIEDDKHFADKGRAAGVHKLAVISITGPESFKVALSKIPATDVVNEIEPKLVDTLKAGGFTIAPLVETREFASANWETIYYDNVPEKTKKLALGNRKMTQEEQLAALKQLNAASGSFGKALTNFGNEGNRIATPNTILMTDFLGRPPNHGDDVRIYSEVLCKTLGEIARRLGADAAVIVRTEPGMLGTGGLVGPAGQGSAVTSKTRSSALGSLVRSVKEPLGGDHPEEILHVVMIDQSGEYVFGEELFVTADAKQGVGAITLHYDEEKTLKGIREATDEAMTKLLERYPK